MEAPAEVTPMDLISSGILLCLSGLFSGLTLGLLSLDKIGLEIVIASGTSDGASPEEQRDAKFAKKILPVRERGNLLLCTLLIGNVAVNSLLSITLAGLTSGFVGFLSSTILIVIFGEIIPQAVCSRHGLRIGSATVWIVKCFLVLTFFCSWPLSLALDRLLGREIGTVYSRNQIKRMMELYATVEDSDLDKEETTLLAGAIDFSHKTVSEVMTKIDEVFMLEIDTPLNFEVMCDIFASGHSRIPVFQKDKQNVIGLLLTKELILIDPDDEIPIRAIISDYFGKNIPKVFPDVKLDEVLDVFQTGRSHLALVHNVDNSGPGDPFHFIVGIVTLEDLMEALIQEEILDETDDVTGGGGSGGNTSSSGVHKRAADRPLLRWFRAMRKRRLAISDDEEVAVYHFLASKWPQVFGSPVMSEATCRQLLRQSQVIKVEPGEAEATVFRRGASTNHFALVLDGAGQIRAGHEDFKSTAGPWSTFAIECLQRDYIPDYTFVLTKSSRVLLITREIYVRIVADERHRIGVTADADVAAQPTLSLI